MFPSWLKRLKTCYVGCIIFEEYYMVYYYFNGMVSPNVSGEQVSEIPELEDISEEEAEMARAEKSKDTTLKVARLKVPQN